MVKIVEGRKANGIAVTKMGSLVYSAGELVRENQEAKRLGAERP